MTAGRLCVRDVDLAESSETVQEAAARMRERNVGTLVVVDGDRRPVGILTDRDIAVRVAANGIAPGQALVHEVMSSHLQSVAESTPIEDALRLMRAGSHRRLPVVDGEGRLAGLLSVDDILDLLAEEFGELRRLLASEARRPPRES